MAQDDETPAADVDPAEFPDAATIQCDAIPELVDDAATGVVDPRTPRPEVTGNHRISQLELASAVRDTDSEAYARGRAHGRAAAVAEAQEAAELRRVREDGVEAFRSFFVIWSGKWPATWEEAEAWYRSRLTPL